jgi:hypothetical protein
MVVNVDKVRVKGKLGFVNAARQPQYRLFCNELDLQIGNFSNQSSKGVMTGSARGKFMGSGATQISFTARPNSQGPDFDLKVAIDNTDMKSMNNLWRSYGNFDVVGGLFSFYSELSVRNGNIEGYVKPLFYEMDVYDQRQDKERNFSQTVRRYYRRSVVDPKTPRAMKFATAVNVSGKLPIPKPARSKLFWESFRTLFPAILPGFERQARPQGKSPSASRVETMCAFKSFRIPTVVIQHTLLGFGFTSVVRRCDLWPLICVTPQLRRSNWTATIISLRPL